MTEPTIKGRAPSSRTRVVTGLDGKTYTVRSRAARLGIIAMTHSLSHEGRSIRGIVAELAARGIRRSVGTVSTDLRGWSCPMCSGGQKETPEHFEAVGNE